MAVGGDNPQAKEITEADLAPAPQAREITENDLQPIVPQFRMAALQQRIANGDAVTRIAQATLQAAQKGFDADPGVITDEDKQTLADWRANPLSHPLRYASQMFLSPFLLAGHGIAKVGNAISEGLGAGAEQTALELGEEKGAAARLRRDVSGMAQLEQMGGGALANVPVPHIPKDIPAYQTLVRAEIDPATGVPHDVPVGPIPEPHEIPGQAQTVVDHFGMQSHAATATINTLNSTGHMPAEVLHDAATNPEVFGAIASGHVPSVYPVTDWAGREIEGTEEPKPAEPTPTAPTPEPQLPEGTITPTTTGAGPLLKPMAGKGEFVESQLAQNIEAHAQEKGMPDDLGPLLGHNRVELEPMWDKMRGEIGKDWNNAVAIATGEVSPPRGVLRGVALRAVEDEAVRRGDWQTIDKLADAPGIIGHAARIGQELRAFGDRDELSPVALIKNVDDAWKTKAQTTDLGKKADQLVAQARQNIQKTNFDVPSWEKFLQTITCK